jgi:L-cysteine desulfidase
VGALAVACTSPIFLAVAAARAHDLEADLLQRVDNPLARYDGKLARTVALLTCHLQIR